MARFQPYRRLTAVAAVGVPAVLLAILAWSHRWTADDGFIHFRVVDQLVHGNGPVFNAGERVEASTSPAWVATLALARLVTPSGIPLEHLALVLSLAGSFLGLTAAGFGAVRLLQAWSPAGERAGRWVVPFGSLLVVALPPFWDFATSGLEMGLVFAWLGCSFWAGAAWSTSGSLPWGRRRWPLAMLLGLGPVLRPDLALFSLCFLLGLVVALEERPWRRRLLPVLAGLAVPGAYQIFRMGYYAAIVPNTAIAKDAGASRWDRGFAYLGDLVGAYELWVPLFLIASVLIVVGTTLWRANQRPALAIAAGPLAGALLHATYITRVGGDFMHGRLLLPAVFALTMPVAVVIPRPRVVGLVAAALAPWALVCAFAFRFDSFDAGNIDDERRVYVTQSGRAYPVTLADYRTASWLVPATDARRFIAGGQRLLGIPAALKLDGTVDDGRLFTLLPRVGARGAVAVTRVGAVAYAAGTDVFVLDRFGLADPIGSRLSGQPLTEPGHDKYVPLAWIEARLAPADVYEPDPGIRQQADDARALLRCGDIARLLRDVQEPLGFGRFFGNFFDSIRYWRLRIPTAPPESPAVGHPVRGPCP